MIVGVTGEGESPTMKYVDDTNWKATIVFESGLASMREYGLKGFPSSVLVNAKGEVVWSGHPGGLEDSVIEQNLAGARPPGWPSAFADTFNPALETPKKFAAIGKKIASGQIGSGMTDLEKSLAGKLSDADKSAAETLQSDVKAIFDDEMKRASESFEAKRYFDAKFTWTRLEKAFKGHSLADEPKQKLEELAADTAIVEELAAGAEIHKALALREADDVEGCLKALKRITGGSLRQTAEGGRAATLIEEIEAEKKAKRK